jgi:hypothetical protein
MAKSNLNFAIFCPLFNNIIPLSINTEIDGFVEIFEHVFAVRFKLHVHSFLVE